MPTSVPLFIVTFTYYQKLQQQEQLPVPHKALYWATSHEAFKKKPQICCERHNKSTIPWFSLRNTPDWPWSVKAQQLYWVQYNVYSLGNISDWPWCVRLSNITRCWLDTSHSGWDIHQPCALPDWAGAVQGKSEQVIHWICGINVKRCIDPL